MILDVEDPMNPSISSDDMHPFRWPVLAVVAALCVLRSSAAPVIAPIGNVKLPAGKSLIIPVTATSPDGRPLTFTASSSKTGISVAVLTNNLFWKMSVAQAANPNDPGAFPLLSVAGLATVTNIGDMTFMLFKSWTPHTVNVIQGLTTRDFTPPTRSSTGSCTASSSRAAIRRPTAWAALFFQFDDEFNTNAIFAGNGQLAMANSGKDSDSSQFFVTIGPHRPLDFGYTLFGQLLRGFNVLTNIENVATNSASRPLADVIITKTSLVPDTTDTVLTLTGTKLVGATATISIIADDGAGGRVTNRFTATTATDTVNDQPFLDLTAATNLLERSTCR